MLCECWCGLLPGRPALSRVLSPVLTQLHVPVEKGWRTSGAGLAGLLCQESGEEGDVCLECSGGHAVISFSHGDGEMEQAPRPREEEGAAFSLPALAGSPTWRQGDRGLAVFQSFSGLGT